MKNLLITLILPLLLIACNNDNPVSSNNPIDNDPNDSTVIPKNSPLVGKWIENLDDTLTDSRFSSSDKKEALGYYKGVYDSSTGLIDTTKWQTPVYPITYVFHQDSVTVSLNDEPLILTVALWEEYFYTNKLVSVISKRPELYSTKYDTLTRSFLIIKDTLFFNYNNSVYNVRYVKE